MSPTRTTESSRPPGSPPGKGLLAGAVSVRVSTALAVALGLFAYVISIAVAPSSGDELWRIFKSTWWIVLLLTIPYLALRALIWHQLLKVVRVEVPWRPLLVSFAAAEITKSLPAGIYVQAYLLARLEHFDEAGVARATMASTAMLGLEAALAVPVALAAGWPAAPWVRWMLLAIVVAWTAALGLAWALIRYGLEHLPAATPGWLRAALSFIEEFLDAGRDLIAWRTVGLLAPTAAYMLIYATDLYIILRALGFSATTFVSTVGIYAYVVLSVILIPIPTEVGLTELTGLFALTAHGIEGSTAAVVILALRALGSGMTMLLSAAILALLWKQLSRAQRAGVAGDGAAAGNATTDAPEDGGSAV